jgi:hypothetical protein
MPLNVRERSGFHVVSDIFSEMYSRVVSSTVAQDDTTVMTTPLQAPKVKLRFAIGLLRCMLWSLPLPLPSSESLPLLPLLELLSLL